MRTQMTPRAVRRLLAADGYLDLGLADRAAAELENIPAAGPLEGPRLLMLGMAKKQLGDFHGAIGDLEKAARMMPRPTRRFVWRELVEAYHAVGAHELSAMAQELGGDAELQLTIHLPQATGDLQLTVNRTSV
ncbi:MAG: hypothetical protein ACKO2P_19535 [Planctomycetota bacterium]